MNAVHHQRVAAGAVAHNLRRARAVAIAAHDEGSRTEGRAGGLQPVETAGGLIYRHCHMGQIHAVRVGVGDDGLLICAVEVGAGQFAAGIVEVVKPATCGVGGDGIPRNAAVFDEERLDEVVVAEGDAGQMSGVGVVDIRRAGNGRGGRGHLPLEHVQGVAAAQFAVAHSERIPTGVGQGELRLRAGVNAPQFAICAQQSDGGVGGVGRVVDGELLVGRAGEGVEVEVGGGAEAGKDAGRAADVGGLGDDVVWLVGVVDAARQVGDQQLVGLRGGGEDVVAHEDFPRAGGIERYLLAVVGGGEGFAECAVGRIEQQAVIGGADGQIEGDDLPRCGVEGVEVAVVLVAEGAGNGRAHRQRRGVGNGVIAQVAGQVVGVNGQTLGVGVAIGRGCTQRDVKLVRGRVVDRQAAEYPQGVGNGVGRFVIGGDDLINGRTRLVAHIHRVIVALDDHVVIGG